MIDISKPNLAHSWRWDSISNITTCVHCGVVQQTPLASYSPVCPPRAAAWGAEQRAAGAAEERAAVVALLRDGPDPGRGTVAWDATVGPILAELAYIIENGEHLPMEVTDGK